MFKNTMDTSLVYECATVHPIFIWTFIIWMQFIYLYVSLSETQKMLRYKITSLEENQHDLSEIMVALNTKVIRMNRQHSNVHKRITRLKKSNTYIYEQLNCIKCEIPNQINIAIKSHFDTLGQE